MGNRGGKWLGEARAGQDINNVEPEEYCHPSFV